ncbi:MAG: radical SAM protein [Candidatus Omnitrophota bacterium]
MRSQHYNIFRERLADSAKVKQFPLQAMFELTYECNFNCVYCYVPAQYREESSQRQLNAKKIFFILDELSDLGCFYLGFTGGEVFLRKDIFDILWYAKRKGFNISIHTNASLVDRKKARELGRIVPSRLDVNINSLSKTNFDHITGARGFFNKTFSAIEYLRKNKIHLDFKTCYLNENKGEINSLKKFSADYGGNLRICNLLMPSLSGTSFDGLKEHNSVSPLTSRHNGRLFSCGVGTNSLIISPFGTLKMCLHIDYPHFDILETSLARCWQRLKKIIQDLKPDKNFKCNSCHLRQFCPWCPARSWAFNKTFTSCDPVCKSFAEEKYLKFQSISQ